MPLQCCCISAVRLPQPSSPARHRPLRLLSTLRRAARRRRQLPIRAAPQGARRPGLLAAWAPSAAAASLMLLAWHGWHGADKGVPSVRLSLASPPTGHRAIKVSPAPRPPQFLPPVRAVGNRRASTPATTCPCIFSVHRCHRPAAHPLPTRKAVRAVPCSSELLARCDLLICPASVECKDRPPPAADAGRGGRWIF